MDTPATSAVAQRALNLPHQGSLWRRIANLPTASVESFQRWGWRHFAFYFGIPIGLALYATLNNWELLRSTGFLNTLAFNVCHSTLPWWANAAVLWMLFSLWPGFARHRLSLIFLGTTLTGLLILPYFEAVSGHFYRAWGIPGLAPWMQGAHGDPIDGFGVYLARAVALTLLVNFIFDRYMGLPRYRLVDQEAAAELDEPFDVSVGTALPLSPANDGEVPAAAATPSAMVERPRFLDRLPETIAADAVLALKAEQHYIRVFTAEKSYLTLYRFSDALGELVGYPGLQVHRSYWVRRDFIERIRSGAGKMTVNLRSGMEIPVSGPYKALLRQLAREIRIPQSPLLNGKTDADG
jgi:hypothetical protein